MTPTITRELGIGAVTALVVESGFTVRLTLGEPARATVHTDDAIADLVDARLEGNRLHLGLRKGAEVPEGALSADVTLRALVQATVSSASRLRFDAELVGGDLVLTALGMSEITGPVRLQQIRVGASGASKVALTGHVHRLAIAASGASVLQLRGLAVAELDVTLSGASVAEVTVRDRLAAESSGASVLRYTGSPQVTRRQATGASLIGQAGS